MSNLPWTPKERKTLRALKTPERVQQFLDDLPYNLEPNEDSCFSPRLTLRNETAHCLEGALLAAAALEEHGLPALLIDLESVRDDDHVLAVYRSGGYWGAIGKSNYTGLRFRSPVYASLRELAISYFDHYYNLQGEKTLRGYGGPVNLRRFDKRGWKTDEGPVWYIPEHLCEIRHYNLWPRALGNRRLRMDKRSFDAGRLGAAK